MKIGFDISMLVYQGSGVATYTYQLVKKLLEIDTKNDYVLFYSSLRRPKNFFYLNELKKLGAHIYDYRLPPRVLEFLWNKHHLLPVEWLIEKVDIFHSSDFLRPPLLKGTRGITTIFDLTWKIYPQYHTDKIVSAHHKKLAKTIRYNDTIITSSQNTKKDLIKYYPEIHENNIAVIPLGVDERYRPIKDINKIKKVLQKYDIINPGNYVLYVGAIEPRKNLDLAIKVFSALIHEKAFSDYKFIIVGRAGWKNEYIFNLVKKLGIQNKIIFTGFVEDEDVPYFYCGASATIYLSLYEGFGLPPIESAACGTPALVAQNSSLSELNSSLITFCDISNIQDPHKKLATIIKKGKPAHAPHHQYTWDACAKQFIRRIIQTS